MKRYQTYLNTGKFKVKPHMHVWDASQWKEKLMLDIAKAIFQVSQWLAFHNAFFKSPIRIVCKYFLYTTR